VNHNRFGPKGLAALLARKPQQLHTLQMVDNDLGDEGVARLAASPAADSLLEVDLSVNRVGDSAARALAETKHLRNLLVLRIDEWRFSEPAKDALVRSPLGQRLAVLESGDIPF
jgi:Ran GTPase-activating protein (RanGAP) involved in mRNA processing and transport